MNKADNLHDVKIIGNGQSNSIFIDGEDVSYGCLEANLNIKAGEFPQLVMKTDVKVSSIELKAEVKEKTKEINKAIIEYETSDGLKTLEVKSENKLMGFADEVIGLFSVEEKIENGKPSKILAYVGLESLKSFRVEKIEEV